MDAGVTPVLTKRHRVRVDAPSAGGAWLAATERWVYPPSPVGAWRGRLDSVRLSLVAFWRAAELDRELAAGARPAAGTLLALHVDRITNRRGRARVAYGLARVLRDALAGPGFSAAVQPDRNEVLAARTVLAVLDRRLRDPQPVTAQGVAMLRELLVDGAGPLYRRREPGTLGSRLRSAAAALEPRGGV
jgi:hypothetical protein